MTVVTFLARYLLLMKINSENNQREKNVGEPKTMNFNEMLHNMLKSRRGNLKEDGFLSLDFRRGN